VQSALALTSRYFSCGFKYLLPRMADGERSIVWISDSKKEAGSITELPEKRGERSQWVSADGESERAKERTPARDRRFQLHNEKEGNTQAIGAPNRQ